MVAANQHGLTWLAQPQVNNEKGIFGNGMLHAGSPFCLNVLKGRFFFVLALWACVGCLCCPGPGYAEDFSFELEEFEKKSLEMGGYMEMKWEHFNLNQGGAVASLNRYDDPAASVDRLTGSLLFNGSYVKGLSTVNWLLKALGSWQEDDWVDSTDVFEAYVALKPTDNLNGSLGKKSYKWGKGYAWNPVGFINRPKDPSNPEEALEGFITAEGEYIKSFSGNLRNMALTTVLLPVAEEVNEDFGELDNLNLAAKLYLLYLDTDLDFLFYTGNSRSTRFGADFSRNITTNFEIHGEYAFFPGLEKVFLEEDGTTAWKKESTHSQLLGIRHLTDFNLTTILEYYHNGGGYSEEELADFYDLVEQGMAQYNQQGLDNLLQQAQKLGQQGYTRPNLGKDYLYSRFSFKEPLETLYFTAALTAICNLDDQSYSITPELLYTGFTNWELRLRFSLLGGEAHSEYGGKLNDNKLELRVRWFF